MDRRDFLRAGFVGATALTAQGCSSVGTSSEVATAAPRPTGSNRINQSVCKWCFPRMSVEELVVASKRIGLESVELLQPADFPTVTKHGLIVAMVSQPAGGIPNGWNRIENHAMLTAAFEQRIPEVARAGFPNVITFSGNRQGMDDQQGLENCALGLKKIMSLAERSGVTVCMELLNSKVNHKDYMCDHTAWGVELVRRVGSERFKLLYDIYHMQIMEGDVIQTIKDNHQYIGHYHTAGVPGRHEIDESQELNYPPIMQAIVDTGFKGYVAQEFIPTEDPIAALAEAYAICNV